MEVKIKSAFEISKGNETIVLTKEEAEELFEALKKELNKEDKNIVWPEPRPAFPASPDPYPVYPNWPIITYTPYHTLTTSEPFKKWPPINKETYSSTSAEGLTEKE